jgi:hypothetical protein
MSGAAARLSIFRRDQQEADTARPGAKGELRLPGALEINRASDVVEDAFCLSIEVVAGETPHDGSGLVERADRLLRLFAKVHGGIDREV